jgi:hypothetical protein
MEFSSDLGDSGGFSVPDASDIEASREILDDKDR